MWCDARMARGRHVFDATKDAKCQFKQPHDWKRRRLFGGGGYPKKTKMCHGHHAIAFALAVSARPATWSLKKPTLTAFKTFPIVLASALMVWQGKAKPTSSFASFSSCQDLPVLACCPFILNAWRNVQKTKKKKDVYIRAKRQDDKSQRSALLYIESVHWMDLKIIIFTYSKMA